VPGVPDETAAILAALRDPIGSAPLRDKVKPGDKVVVVHSDITRATPNDRLLPVILKELEAAGIRREDMTLLNGLGTHRPQTDAELRKMLGDEIVDNYRCMQHDANDDANLIPLGTTSLGHPVRVNRLLIESDVRILTGFIEPHFFAGFSGGPKAILPSLAGAETVLTNHGYMMVGHPNATWGITEGNPIWEEMREVALRTNPTFLVNVTLNTDKRITGVFAGDLLAAHRAGCDFVRANAMVPLAAPYDIAITTNSGYPLDQNLYQAIKGVSAASRVIRPGGSIIMCAACQDGVPAGSGYAKLMAEAGSPQRVLEMVATPGFAAPDQWNAQIQSMVLMNADVFIYSDGVTPAEVEAALYKSCPNVEALVAQLMDHYGAGARACVIPDGPQTVAYIGEPVAL
jgi:nickel-dependent lactate racemase